MHCARTLSDFHFNFTEDLLVFPAPRHGILLSSPTATACAVQEVSQSSKCIFVVRQKEEAHGIDPDAPIEGCVMMVADCLELFALCLSVKDDQCQVSCALLHVRLAAMIGCFC